MELNYRVENLDDVSEAFRELYNETKEGGKTVYTLKINGVKPQDEFDKVYNTLAKERKLREEKEKALNAFGEHTPESITAMSDELEALKVTKASASEEDYQKRFSEAKSAWQKSEELLKQNFEAEKAKYETLLSQKDQENINMRLETRLSALYSEKGDPSGRDLAFNLAKHELRWNPDTQDFETHDGVLSIKDWMEDSLFKNHTCLLKPSLSAGARGSEGSAASYEKYFDPSRAGYSEDPSSESYQKRLECFRKDPEKARGFLAKFANKR